MKQGILALICVVLLPGMLSAQEYKVAKASGRLVIHEVNHVSIKGHSGNEIVFSSTDPVRERDERAAGLRAISSLGLEDNTGLGLSVVVNGEAVEVRQLKKTEGPKIEILVPAGVAVQYRHSSPYGGQLRVNDFAGKVEASTVHNGVVLNNASGPVSVKTVHGDIEASFSAPLQERISLESTHGHVDVALPATAKADVTLSTNWGEMLVDPDLSIQLEKSGGLVNYSGKIHGTLNGGGVEIALTAHHNNVYLRQK